jgi:hypothetical protein
LRGEEGKGALRDFQQLGSAAIPALIRGLNRAANIEGSCPAVVIAKKLGAMLRASNDPALMQFARENIGVGVSQSRHKGLLRELRVMCTARQRALGQRRAAPTPFSELEPASSPGVVEIRGTARTGRGPRPEQAPKETDPRGGTEALRALYTSVASASDEKSKQAARDRMVQYLSRQNHDVVKETLNDSRAEVRAAAARVAGGKGPRFGAELIDLLGDEDEHVLQAVRQALTQLARGADFGPKRNASDADRRQAERSWRAWWAKQSGR